MTKIVIRSFDPPVMELPKLDPIPAGELAIELPALRVVFGALDLMPEAKVKGELPGFGVTMTLQEPIARATLVALVTELWPQLEAMNGIMQEEVTKRGPLFGPGQLPPALALQAIANSW